MFVAGLQPFRKKKWGSEIPWPEVQSIYGVLNTQGNVPKGLDKNHCYNVNFVSSSISNEKRRGEGTTQLTLESGNRVIENQSVCYFLAVEGYCTEFLISIWPHE